MLKKDPTMTREEQLAEQIKQMILELDMQPGDQLPSVRELADRYKAGKATITGALELLHYEGVVHTKLRLGTFVTKDIWQKYAKQVDWRRISNLSPYRATNKEFLEVLSIFKNTNSISMPTVSDGIYNELLQHSSAAFSRLISESPIMEKYHGSGMYELKVSLVKHMARYGLEVDPRQIALANTTHDAYSLIANLLIWHGSTVYYESPGPLNYYPYFHAVGAHMCNVETDGEGATPEGLIKAIAKHHKGVLVTSPLYSFPAGNTASLNRKKEILKICTNSDIPIVELDDFRDLDHGAPATYFTLDNRNSVIYIGSFLRTLPFGMPFSWIVVPFRLIPAIEDIKYQINWGPNAVTQIMINSMLGSGEYYTYMEKLKKYVRFRHEFSDDILKKHLTGLAEWSGKNPIMYWLKLPVSFEKLLRVDSDIQFFTGDFYEKGDKNHILVSKTCPDTGRYERGIISLKNNIMTACRA